MTADIGTRVELLEVGVRQLGTTMAEMRQEQQTERREIAAAFESLRRDLSKTSRPFPFKEVAAAVSITIAVIGAGVQCLNWWYDARSAVVLDHVAVIEKYVDPSRQAVLEYRLKLLEEGARTPIASK